MTPLPVTLRQISASLPEKLAVSLAEAVSEHETLVLSASAFESADGNWEFTAICDGEPDIDQLNRITAEALNQRFEFAVVEVADIDWVARSLESLPTVETDAFRVHGSHNRDAGAGEKIAIEINAGQAFGTGHHETTTGCLEALSAFAHDHGRAPARILDLGTGSGILAIAAAKCLAGKVLATDIDEKALEIARENAAINGTANHIQFVRSAGLDHPVFARTGPFDLILANILAQPLIELAPGIRNICTPGTTIVLAGLLNRQAGDVIPAYLTDAIDLVGRSEKGDWTILTFRRNA